MASQSVPGSPADSRFPIFNPSLLTSPMQSSPTIDLFISTASLPRVQAFYAPSAYNYSETFANANLTVPEGSFLILMCAALYNITWSKNETNFCSDPATDHWPSKKCLIFDPATSQDSSTYSCYHESRTDPRLVTDITLKVIRTKANVEQLKIVKKSFDNVFTFEPRPIELSVEYEVPTKCDNDCKVKWILLPKTVIDFSNVNVETTQLSATRRRSRLVIPRTCHNHSGVYRLEFGDENRTKVDFNVTIGFSSLKKMLQPSLADWDSDSYHATFFYMRAYYTKLLLGRVYEMSFWSPEFEPVENKSVTMELEFLNLEHPNFCPYSLFYNSTRNNTPDDAYVKDMNNTQFVSSFLCISDEEVITNRKLYVSTFTLTATRPGMVRCKLKWTITDDQNRTATTFNYKELRYKIVDRADFLPAKNGLTLEQWPNHRSPLVGESMTIKCLTPACVYDDVVLEKDFDKKVIFNEDFGITRNDFNTTALVVFDRKSPFIVVASLTIEKITELDSGRYTCYGSDRDIATIARSDADIYVQTPRTRSFTEVAIGVVAAIAFSTSICFSVWLHRRWRLASLRKLHAKMLRSPRGAVSLNSFVPLRDQIECLPYDEERYEIEKIKFTLFEVLGSGEFGKVYRGVWKTPNGFDLDVAVKIPQNNLNVEQT